MCRTADTERATYMRRMELEGQPEVSVIHITSVLNGAGLKIHYSQYSVDSILLGNIAECVIWVWAGSQQEYWPHSCGIGHSGTPLQLSIFLLLSQSHGPLLPFQPTAIFELVPDLDVHVYAPISLVETSS